MKSLLSRATSLLVALASASLLVACTVNADDQAAPSDDPQPAAAVETAAQPAAVAPEPEPATESPATTESEQPTETTQPAAVEAAPEPPSRPAADVQVRANTPRKDTAQPVASAALQRALAKSFYTFGEFATLDLPPNLIVAWGLGAPRGAYVISASIWTATAQGARALSDTELLSGGTLRSDEAIRLVEGATADRAWLEAFGVAGAHGVSYDLLLWNGRQLLPVVGHFSSAPGNVVAPGAAAELRDLNGDGDPELVIDRTDAYLFFYTSQIWHADAAVLRRVGDDFHEVALSLPPATVGDEALAGARSSIAFADAGWWPYALEHAEAALELAPDNEQLAWNLIVIRERAGAALREAERNPIPWLGQLLAGDWGRTIEELRAFPHLRWLELDFILRDTPLEGLESAVGLLVEQRTAAALSAADHLPVQHVAPTYLMRGLARWWLGEGMLPAAIEFVEAIPGYWSETTVFDLLFATGYRGG